MAFAGALTKLVLDRDSKNRGKVMVEDLKVSYEEHERVEVVVLLSGGIDSSTLLYLLDSQGYDCYPIVFDYGQRHRKEMVAAGLVWRSIHPEKYKRLKLVDLTSLTELLPSTLTGKGEIPNGHYADAVMSQTVVPNRNMILLSIAAGYAEGIGAGLVAYAAHSGDHPIYPDCRPEFIASVSETIRKGTGGKVGLLAPFISFFKYLR